MAATGTRSTSPPGPLALPALYACWTALGFANQIATGTMWNGVDEAIKAAEIYHYGLPLIAATAAAIVLGWLRPRVRGAIAPADVTLSICAVGVAIYLIAIYGTLARNSTGTPFAPIGISLAAVAGTALIMELTRRVAGLALIVIAGIFLIYTFVGERAARASSTLPTSNGPGSSAKSTPMPASSGRPRRCRRPTSSSSSSSRPSSRRRRSATTSSTSPSPAPAAPGAVPPRSPSSPPASWA